MARKLQNSIPASSDAATPAEAPAGKRPIHRIRLGYLQAALWENETPHGVRHSVTLERLYTDAEGKWQSTRSFNESDLPGLAALLHLAIADLHHRRSEPWDGD
jgi:hypothetical protein